MPPSHVRIINKILNVCTIIGQILGEVIKHKANKGQKADVRLVRLLVLNFDLKYLQI